MYVLNSAIPRACIRTISNLKFVRFRSCGKQFGPNPTIKREPIVALHAGVKAVSLVGVVVSEPMVGAFFECTNVGAYEGALAGCGVSLTNLNVEHGVFLGQTFSFTPEGIDKCVHQGWGGGSHF